MVQYDQTAYGKVTVLKDTVGIANINPFRYKGYYYDQESAMYYCHTRYYVPEWGRWLNVDNPIFLDATHSLTLNSFVYCDNNPIANIDPSGAFWFTCLTTLVGAVVGAASSVITSLIKKEEITLKKVIGGAVAGAVTGFVLGITKGAAIAAASYSAAAAESVFYEVWDYASGDKDLNAENIKLSLVNVVTDTLVNGTINYISNSVAANIGPIRTNAGWFVPQSITSYFTKSFGQKMIAQTIVAGVVGSGLYLLYDAIENIVSEIKESIAIVPSFAS